MSREWSPEDLGYKAYMDGDSQDSNPHAYGSDDWNRWNNGFEEAKSEEN